MSEVTSPYRYSEARFADITGLSRADAKYYRDTVLKKGEHWERHNDGEIALLTLQGVKRLWRCLEKKPLTLDLSACEMVNGSGKKMIVLGGPRTMRVTLVPANPYILHARDALGQDYVVRRSAGHFSVGLEIEAKPDTTEGYWRVVGPVPRFPGDRGYKR